MWHSETENVFKTPHSPTGYRYTHSFGDILRASHVNLGKRGAGGEKC